VNKISRAMMHGFTDELRKIAQAGAMPKPPGFWARHGETVKHGLEVGGLGALAVPSVHALRDKDSTDKEKKHAKYELAGLGVLAAPEVASLAHKAVTKMKKGSVVNPSAMGGRAGRILSGAKAPTSMPAPPGASPPKPKLDVAAVLAAKKSQGPYRGLGQNPAAVVKPPMIKASAGGYRPAPGSLRASAMDYAFKHQPRPPAPAPMKMPMVNATPERRDLLQHFMPKSTVKPKKQIELPQVSGPMIIER